MIEELKLSKILTNGSLRVYKLIRKWGSWCVAGSRLSVLSCVGLVEGLSAPRASLFQKCKQWGQLQQWTVVSCHTTASSTLLAQHTHTSSRESEVSRQLNLVPWALAYTQQQYKRQCLCLESRLEPAHRLRTSSSYNWQQESFSTTSPLTQLNT